MKPLVLCILDGFGVGDSVWHNAITNAKMPFYQQLLNQYPHTTLTASGLAVGLPNNQFGNSEVGHANIGAGRVVMQMLTQIDMDVEQRVLAKNPVISRYLQHPSKIIHLVGLLSKGGVHSHENHIFEAARVFAEHGFIVKVHGITDGRDTPPQFAQASLVALQELIEQYPTIQLTTLCGRFYAMDRDQRFERTELAYRLYTEGKGVFCKDPLQVLDSYYQQGIYDEFIPPINFDVDFKGINDNEVLWSLNFRTDRMKQLMQAFLVPDFKGFVRQVIYKDLQVAIMTHYSNELAALSDVVYKEMKIDQPLGEILSLHGLRQLRIAESEKFPHVTFFFDGLKERNLPLCESVAIPSPKVATYDLQPEMSIEAVTQRVMESLMNQHHDVIILNFANPDMVGHTGKLDCAIVAVEAVDRSLATITQVILKQGGVLCITADHGNCEEMFDEVNQQPHTAHTHNPVPLMLVGEALKGKRLQTGKLADIAPTLLTLLNLPIPEAMTGINLLAD